MPKLCDFQNCRKRASYGLIRNCPERCTIHKENRKLVSMICNCGKARPHFNEVGETFAVCCSSCKTATMVDVKSKKCNCGNAQPTYNEVGETAPICCVSCKTYTMVDVKSKKCRCGKSQPNFNELGETFAVCCSSCKTATMVDVKNKKCNCGNAQPTYNEVGETQAVCCSSCKTDTMVDIKSKKCRCGKSQPNFNEVGETQAVCCASCKTDTMVDVKNKKCKCGNAQPHFNEPGETTAVCCASCKTLAMVDVKNKRCNGFMNMDTNTLETCPNDTAGNVKYKNYCVECFRRNFPLDPLTFQIRSKTKEIAVRDFINANFEGFQHNKRLQTGHCDCTIRRSIDHRMLIGNTLIAIETDENQHKAYNEMDEETRYDDLFMAHSGKWIYIRFNPDKYINAKGILKNPMIATRLEALKTEIEKQIIRVEREENVELVERVYMYYDGYA
jgi:hypothetical protein